MHKKLNKIFQEPDWPFVSFWNLKSLYSICSHLFPFVVWLTLCHSLSLVIIYCHSMPFVVALVIIRCHSFPFLFTCCTTHCHLLLLVVTQFTTRLPFYKRPFRMVLSDIATWLIVSLKRCYKSAANSHKGIFTNVD